MSEYLDVDAYTEIMKAAMARHFTANELEAMADFYSSPAGKSAMGKMGAYMGDVMPAALAEVQKAIARMQADEAAAD